MNTQRLTNDEIAAILAACNGETGWEPCVASRPAAEFDDGILAESSCEDYEDCLDEEFLNEDFLGEDSRPEDYIDTSNIFE